MRAFILLLPILLCSKQKALNDSYYACLKGKTPQTVTPTFIEKMTYAKECLPGKTLPDFSATTMDGKTYTNETLKGKVVLVNFWFIACAPCVAEIPTFNELTKTFGDDLVILSFATDKEDRLKEFMTKRPVNFPVVASADKFVDEVFKLDFGFPTNILLNKNGEIADFSIGGATDEAGLTQQHERLLKKIQSEISK
jgi:peroxiredoxin